MKKILFWLALATFVFVLPITVLAQDVGGDPVVFPDLNEIFTSTALFAAGVIALTGLLTRAVNFGDLGRSIASLIIALILGVIGFVFQLGIFEGTTWGKALLIVIMFAITSNVLYDIPWLRRLFTRIGIVKAKSTTQLRR